MCNNASFLPFEGQADINPYAVGWSFSPTDNPIVNDDDTADVLDDTGHNIIATITSGASYDPTYLTLNTNGFGITDNPNTQTNSDWSIDKNANISENITATLSESIIISFIGLSNFSPNNENDELYYEIWNGGTKEMYGTEIPSNLSIIGDKIYIEATGNSSFELKGFGGVLVPIPEPSTYLLLGSLAMVAVGLKRRKQALAVVKK